MNVTYTIAAEPDVAHPGNFAAVLIADGHRFARALYATYAGGHWLEPLRSEEEALLEAHSRWDMLMGRVRDCLVVRVDDQLDEDTDTWAPSASSWMRDLDLQEMRELSS